MCLPGNLPAGPFWILRDTLVVMTLASRSLVDSPRLKALSAPSRFLPLPLSFFRSALSLRRGFCRSREDLCVGEGVGVLVKMVLRDDVGCGWISEDTFYS